MPLLSLTRAQFGRFISIQSINLLIAFKIVDKKKPELGNKFRLKISNAS